MSVPMMTTVHPKEHSYIQSTVWPRWIRIDILSFHPFAQMQILSVVLEVWNRANLLAVQIIEALKS